MAHHSGGWLATCSQSMGMLVFSACCLLLGFAALPRWGSHRQTARYESCSSCLALLSVLFRVECQSALRRLSLYSTLLVSAVSQSVCFTACLKRCSECGWCSHRGHLAAVVFSIFYLFYYCFFTFIFFLLEGRPEIVIHTCSSPALGEGVTKCLEMVVGRWVSAQSLLLSSFYYLALLNHLAVFSQGESSC